MSHWIPKHENIARKKQEKGYKDRHIRKIEKFSEPFNKIFFFFLKCYQKKLLTFAGSAVDVVFDKNSHSCREAFRRFDDGQFKYRPISTRHPNIVKAVITAKKSWGLHLKMYSEGIAEGTFTKSEILHIFESNKIELPEQFKVEFENIVIKKRIEYYEKHSL
jgi:hypothetical protein